MAERDPFYVGYLPIPGAIKRFIVPWLIGNVALAVGIAAVVAQQHREPGDGTWDTGSIVKIEGELVIDPYPLLHAAGKTYILVEQGKLGVQQRIADGQIKPGRVVVTGFLVEREGRTVLELDSAETDPLKPVDRLGTNRLGSPGVIVDRARLAEVSRHLDRNTDLGTHTLAGEIIDPKCYHGVMRPGDGKTHKTCATLCIKGGIPPMLLVRDEKGRTAAYLLTDEAGRPFPESHYGFIADPIELTGRVLRDGDLLVLRADPGSIRRLGPVR